MKSAIGGFLAFALAASFAPAATVLAGASVAEASVPPRPPSVLLDTSYQAPSGAVLHVHEGGDLQAALDAAQPGEQIVLDAGTTYTGNFVLPRKAGSGTIVVRSSDVQDLPEGVRAGPADAGHMARLVSPSFAGAIEAAPAARGWRLIGIEATVAAAVNENTGLVRLGSGEETSRSQLPSEIVIDRCWIHGNAGQNDRRGVALNGIAEAVVDSTVSEIHEVGYDSQAIAGWNGAGPFKIVDDELDAAGENLMFGGADPAIAKLTPSDIEIRHNHFDKPLSWRVGEPNYAGVHWTVKNILELKNARRVLISGNVFEHSWGDAQTGFAINLKSANQEGTAPWSNTRDVTFTDNIVRHAGAGIGIEGRDPGGAKSATSRIAVDDNLLEDIDGKQWKGPGALLQIIAGSPSPGGSLNGPSNVAVDHNTAFQSGSLIVADGAPSRGFTFTNNIAPVNQYGVKGSGTGSGNETIKKYFPGAVFTANVLVGARCSSYPAGDFCPAGVEEVGFADYAHGDYRLAAGSPYRGAATDGTDVGADIGAVLAATGE